MNNSPLELDLECIDLECNRIYVDLERSRKAPRPRLSATTRKAYFDRWWALSMIREQLTAVERLYIREVAN